MSQARAFVYVQHLLGIGHLKRAAALARALVAEGLEVTLASGGFPVPEIDVHGARFVQLPAAGAADLGFKNLIGEHRRPLDDRWKRRRAEALLAAWREADPQVLVIELFPFGRRQMRFELLPLLEAAAHAPRRPTVVCSVRDVLGGGQKDPRRQDEMLELVERHFDHVLVHGDPAVIGFERSFRHAARIAGRIEYTGYILDPAFDPGSGAGADEVIVSAGGGAVGAQLMEAAIRARPLTALQGKTWRLLAGINLQEEAFAKLSRLASESGEGRIVLERSRRDFTALLANCVLSVSQAGYNTLLEIVRARARAVAVPFARGSETEQALRARCFAERGLLELVEEDSLAPQTLAAAIDRTARKPRPAACAIDLDGARRSATLIARWAAERPS